ncbi:MAG: hypothetical protein AB4040_16515 [Synechococcus sp.]
MTRYDVLLEVEVLHDYSLNRGEIVHEALNLEHQARVMEQYSSTRFLSITPTLPTVRVLAGHQMLFKTTATGFLVAVKLDPESSESRPTIPLSLNFKLAFALQVSDPYFYNYTALSSDSQGFFFFSNQSGNEATGGQFLSVPVPIFDPSQAYQADEVYSEPSGDTVNLFRALRDTGSAVAPVAADWERIPNDTFDASEGYLENSIALAENRIYRALIDLGPGSDLDDDTQWEQFDTLANQYVTSADRVTIHPNLFNIDLSSLPLPRATLRIFRHGETVALWEQHYEAENGNLETAQVVLSGIVPGLYRLEVLDESLAIIPQLGFEFYLDSTAVREGWFGVIEIGLGSGELALLDDSGNLRTPRYTLRFLNRATRWRYHFPADQAVGNGADVTPEDPDNSRILVTALPRPLTLFATGILLQAENTEPPQMAEEVLLPEPGINRIRRQNAQWYSEIHLSNLPL